MSRKNIKICIVLGTRPEIIKMYPVIKECERRKMPFFVIHTGQHYSYKMDEIFFKDLGLAKPAYNLETGSGSHAYQTAHIIQRVEEILIKENPTVVLVQGDTNSGLAAALAAVKLHIKVAHIEAGLRSYDRKMPEEINRILMDHMADVLYVPTILGSKNAKKEGIDSEKIVNVGNTVVDSVLSIVSIAESKSKILDDLGISKDAYFLVTAHRPENTDNIKRLALLVESIKKLSQKYEMKIIWPIHPRAKSYLEKYKLYAKLNALKNLKIIEPLGFFDFLNLQANARLVLTDSGGIQEETCILKVPCVTLRDNTERPESVAVGANVLCGVTPDKVLNGVKKMLGVKRTWKNPFGDGTSAKLILNHLLALTEKM